MWALSAQVAPSQSNSDHDPWWNNSILASMPRNYPLVGPHKRQQQQQHLSNCQNKQPFSSNMRRRHKERSRDATRMSTPRRKPMLTSRSFDTSRACNGKSDALFDVGVLDREHNQLKHFAGGRLRSLKDGSCNYKMDIFWKRKVIRLSV